MTKLKVKTTSAGLLFILSMVAGVLSVAPAIDSAEYLTEAAANSNAVIIGAVFQFIMSLTYIGIPILLYPILKRFGESLAIGFVSFRIIASALIVLGTIILMSLLTVSQEFVKNAPRTPSDLEALGNVLKVTRDNINHVFMVLVLCAGNFMFYILLIKSKLIPKWISAWGLFGTLLSAFASVLVLFSVAEIITTEYLLLNAPTALLELILGIWLIFKGFDKRLTGTND